MLCCWPLCPASAQLGDFTFRLLNGDTTAGPDHDTTYIVSYRDDLTPSFVATTQASRIALRRKDGGHLTYATNTPAQYGLCIDYKWISVEATFTVPGLSRFDESTSPTEAQGIGFGFTGRRWWFRNFFRNTKGFHITEPGLVDPGWQEGHPYPFREDIRNFTYMASLNRGFNARRYSHNAAIWQIERQKRSAGSFTAGATFWYGRTGWEGSLVPVELQQAFETPTVNANTVERWIVTVTAGYAHTFSLWEHGFINAMVVPGVGSQHQRVRVTQGVDVASGWDLAATAELRIGAGYVGDRWYAALTANTYRSTGGITADAEMATSFVSTRFAAGWRFKNIKPLIPALGL